MYEIDREARRKGLLEEYKGCVNDLEKSVGEIKSSEWTATTVDDFISAVIKYNEMEKIVRELSLNRGPGSDKDPFVQCGNYAIELLKSFKRKSS